MTKGTLLVVDDAPGVVFLLREALNALGYRVVTAVAREAVQLARELRPDLILLDVMMPGVDGVEVGCLLRADAQTVDIPIIAISALPCVTLRLHYMEMGADDYLPKPFELDDLLGRVEKWVGRRSLPCQQHAGLAARLAATC